MFSFSVALTTNTIDRFDVRSRMFSSSKNGQQILTTFVDTERASVRSVAVLMSSGSLRVSLHGRQEQALLTKQCSGPLQGISGEMY
jgi:hypothetical protein